MRNTRNSAKPRGVKIKDFADQAKHAVWRLRELDEIPLELEAEGKKESPSVKLSRIKTTFYGHSVLAMIHEKRDIMSGMQKKIDELEEVVLRLRDHLQQMQQQAGVVQ